MPKIYVCDKCDTPIRQELMTWRLEGWKTKTYYFCNRCHAELTEQFDKWLAKPLKIGRIVKMENGTNVTAKTGGKNE